MKLLLKIFRNGITKSCLKLDKNIKIGNIDKLITINSKFKFQFEFHNIMQKPWEFEQQSNWSLKQKDNIYRNKIKTKLHTKPKPI